MDKIVRKDKRGFASMNPEKQKEIASRGGRSAHKLGVAHEWNSKEASVAGRLGGKAQYKNTRKEVVNMANKENKKPEPKKKPAKKK